jgi:hypothetical protein
VGNKEIIYDQSYKCPHYDLEDNAPDWCRNQLGEEPSTMNQPPKLFKLSAHPDVPEHLVKIMEEEINKHLQPYQAEILNHIQEKGRNYILWGTPTPPLP